MTASILAKQAPVGQLDGWSLGGSVAALTTQHSWVQNAGAPNYEENTRH